MADRDTIVERVRKLMAVAGDGVATDGEIENAMRLAAKLMDQNHIDKGELDQQGRDEELTMGRSFGNTVKPWIMTWETTLAWAIEELYGCVKHYLTHEKVVKRKNGMAVLDRKGKTQTCKRIAFYGPAVEAAEAAAMFEEWALSIATMGLARWGGFTQKDGGNYCSGFAMALYEKAKRINAERQLTQARPIAALTGPQTTAITLAGRYDILKGMAKDWLRDECGVKLSSGGSRSGYKGGRGAYHEGHAHWSSAAFGRRVQRKLLG